MPLLRSAALMLADQRPLRGVHSTSFRLDTDTNLRIRVPDRNANSLRGGAAIVWVG